MIEHAVVALEGIAVVIPVAGHGEGVGDEGTKIGVEESHVAVG
jgi:hypothetical protein